MPIIIVMERSIPARRLFCFRLAFNVARKHRDAPRNRDGSLQRGPIRYVMMPAHASVSVSGPTAQGVTDSAGNDSSNHRSHDSPLFRCSRLTLPVTKF
jgi:hypothetical protein